MGLFCQNFNNVLLVNLTDIWYGTSFGQWNSI